jgi:hypothetical protein
MICSFFLQNKQPTFENINLFSFIRKKYILLKNAMYMIYSSDGYAAHPVRYNNPMQIKMAVRHTSFTFELAELGLAAHNRL